MPASAAVDRPSVPLSGSPISGGGAVTVSAGALSAGDCDDGSGDWLASLSLRGITALALIDIILVLLAVIVASPQLSRATSHNSVRGSRPKHSYGATHGAAAGASQNTVVLSQQFVGHDAASKLARCEISYKQTNDASLSLSLPIGSKMPAKLSLNRTRRR